MARTGGSGLVLFGGTCPAHLSGAPAISRIVLVISREKRFGVTRGPAGPDSWNRRENTRKSRLTIVLYFGLIRFHCHIMCDVCSLARGLGLVVRRLNLVSFLARIDSRSQQRRITLV